MDKEDKKEIVGMFEHLSDKMDRGFKDIRSEMATKDDLKRLEIKVDDGFKEVRNDIHGVRRDIDSTTEIAESSKGFSKEIDTLFNEIGKVKKHVGMETS